MPAAGPGPAPAPVRRLAADYRAVAGRRPAVAAQGLRLGRGLPADFHCRPARSVPPFLLPPQPFARVAVLAGVSGGQRLCGRRIGLVVAVRLPGCALQPSAVVAVHPRRRCPTGPARRHGQRSAAGGRGPDLAAAHRTTGDPPARRRGVAACQPYSAGLRPARWRPGPDRRQGAAVPPSRQRIPDVRPSRSQPGSPVRPDRPGPGACRDDLAVPRPVRPAPCPPGILSGAGREPAVLHGHRPDRTEAGRRSPGRLAPFRPRSQGQGNEGPALHLEPRRP